MGRWFDVRSGELRGQLAGFATVLLLIIASHTTLETARDALLLAGPGPRALGLAYMVIAAGTVPGAALATFVGARVGQRAALRIVLLVAIAGPVALFAMPSSTARAFATYALSGILGSIVVPQFWTLVATVLTVGQGRRLLGLVSAAGVVGGVLGPTVASATLAFLPARALLPISSAGFALALAATLLARSPERTPALASARQGAPLHPRVFRDSPFVVRVALIVFLSTATFLAVDYLFKSSVARSMPGADIARYIAHYYLALSLLSLVVQLASGSIIRRLGVLPALLPTPLLLFIGAALAFLTRGALPVALLVKGVDGSVRYSLHRVTSELVYLPVPPAVKQRTKPFIDGTIARVAQTATGALLLLLGGAGMAGPRPVAAVAALLALTWLVTVVSMRRPYLSLLRHGISRGSLDGAASADPVDLESAQAMVDSLGSGDSHVVVGAIRALAQRGRLDLVPALVLLHHDEAVLLEALDVLGASTRTDWVKLADRLLEDSRETVRLASARALCRQGHLDASHLAGDIGWRARGYAAVRLALSEGRRSDLVSHPALASLLAHAGESGSALRLGMLAAVADAPATPRLAPLLHLLASEPHESRERTELLAQAAVRQKDTRVVPQLVASLSTREAREGVRSALVTLGEPALAELIRALRDPATPRRLRVHVPKSLARFGSRRAADVLMREVETGSDGVVRAKAIRSLRLLVTDHRIAVDRLRAERAAFGEIELHFARLAQRLAFEKAATSSFATTVLLLELLDEQAARALERAFQLVQISHPRQGVHRAYVASRSSDAYARATAAELIDALLVRRDQRPLRALLRVATDDLSSADRVGRARALLPWLVQGDEAARSALVNEGDPLLAALVARLPPLAALSTGAPPCAA
jgi:hypothetical protein